MTEAKLSTCSMTWICVEQCSMMGDQFIVVLRDKEKKGEYMSPAETPHRLELFSKHLGREERERESDGDGTFGPDRRW